MRELLPTGALGNVCSPAVILAFAARLCLDALACNASPRVLSAGAGRVVVIAAFAPAASTAGVLCDVAGTGWLPATGIASRSAALIASNALEPVFTATSISGTLDQSIEARALWPSEARAISASAECVAVRTVDSAFTTAAARLPETAPSWTAPDGAGLNVALAAPAAINGAAAAVKSRCTPAANARATVKVDVIGDTLTRSVGIPASLSRLSCTDVFLSVDASVRLAVGAVAGSRVSTLSEVAGACVSTCCATAWPF
jgi:hypothetical protein